MRSITGVRGARRKERKDGKAEGVRVLFRDRPLVIFLVCAVLFHFANAAMLPLLGEMLAKGKGRSSMMFMSACVVTTQLVITLIAAWVGAESRLVGQKAAAAHRVWSAAGSRTAVHADP